MTLQEIKNEVAKEQGLTPYFVETVLDQLQINKFYNEVLKRYARECVKASLERAAEHAEIITTELRIEHGRGYTFRINKSSISDIDNIVLL